MRKDVRKLDDYQCATNLSKLDIFNRSGEFKRAARVTDSMLSGISFYTCWRRFAYSGGRLSKRQREAFIAVNGAGWPRQAATIHAMHADYAKKTLYAYMPCAGLRGTDFIDEIVVRQFRGI